MSFFGNLFESVVEDITEAEFLSNTEENGGCLEWVGKKNRGGYGIFRWMNAEFAAHRFSYLMFVGPLPESSVVRHLCDNPSCVKPQHLSKGTAKDNIHDAIARGRHRSIQAKSATHCHAGHPWSDENTYTAPKTGKRNCRVCARARRKR
jgi:L-amino acid N-acyltransferase YncA